MSFSVRLGVPEEKTIIHSLLQPYLDELCRFTGEIAEYKDEHGIFQYPYLDAYWQEKERFPYLLVADERIAGFALVRKDNDHWEIAEFFIKPEFRRRGLGEAATLVILKKHPGLWQISYNKHNKPGQHLWIKLAEKFTKDKVKTGELDVSHDFVSFSV